MSQHTTAEQNRRSSIEQTMYGTAREYPPQQSKLCGLSTVDAQAKIEINGHPHAGMVSHVCRMPSEPYHDVCQCACGATWVRNVK